MLVLLVGTFLAGLLRVDTTMAEFCKQCYATFLDLDQTDFEGLCDEGFTTIVLCEGCGPAQVDSKGVCVSPDCLEQHGKYRED